MFSLSRFKLVTNDVDYSSVSLCHIVLHFVIGKLTYHQRLSILELDSLKLRCVRADLIFTYKLVFGLIDASMHDFFVPRFNDLDEVTIINCDHSLNLH